MQQIPALMAELKSLKQEYLHRAGLLQIWRYYSPTPIGYKKSSTNGTRGDSRDNIDRQIQLGTNG